MAEILIYQSEAKDVRALAHRLRAGDKEEIEVYGFPTNVALWRSYRNSIMRYTAFVDGEIAAMWGVGGAPMAEVGQPWLLTSDAVSKVSPLRFARIYQEQVLNMLTMFPKLVNYVDYQYTQAIRLLDIIGFRIGAPEPLGPKGALFCKFEMEA